jgi:hypothetical protein
MKKVLLLLALVNYHFAFAIDNILEKPNVTADFSQLDQIEKEVNESNSNYAELVNLNPKMLSGINLNPNTNLVLTRGGDLPLGVPAIVWGFCCTVPGLALVYFQTDNDKEQVKKAAIGCVAGTIVWFGGWFLLGRSAWY